MDLRRVDAILDAAAADGRSSLLEHEVYEVLRAAGCHVPRCFLAPSGGGVEPRALQALGGSRVVLKVVSPEIVHKTEVGGVRVVDAVPASVDAGIRDMLAGIPGRDIRGVLVVEFVETEGDGVGAEALVALRHSREFGPVVTMGVGGVDTELLAGACREGLAVATASAAMSGRDGLLDVFRPTLAYRRLAGVTRSGSRLVGDAEILRVLDAMLELGRRYGHDGAGSGWTITELEVNPFGASRGELVALDGLLRFRARAEGAPGRPDASIDALLRPRSIAVIGVSSQGANIGRVILDNVLRAGFDPARMWVVHPGRAEIGGVACVADVGDLPERVDLVVIAVSAAQVPAIVEELVRLDRAVGVIVIPGGMGEWSGGRDLEDRLRESLHRGRAEGRPTVAIGPNCLGIVSLPGRYDTLFIPRPRLPLPEAGEASTALISQSGGFMITRLSKLPWLRPRYAISTGNQADVTIGDFLRRVAADPAVRTFAVYVEGFQDADGLEFARAVREVVDGGRDVVFYKAGRTAEGGRAAVGHTASIAGDLAVCEAVVGQAGALVARTFDEFVGHLRISALAGTRAWRGRRLGAVSNAGFEAVGIADTLRGNGWRVDLAQFAPGTHEALLGILAGAHADSLVDVRNPIDLTPMSGDEVYEETLRALVGDPGVDLVLCSVVPLAATVATLPGDLVAEGSLPHRLSRVLASTDKPIVASVDGGPLFDPLAEAIEEAGAPVFRSVDTALSAMGRYADRRLPRSAGLRPA